MRKMRFIIFSFLFLVIYSNSMSQSTIQLPPPETKGGMPLMEVLEKRQSSRSFKDSVMSEQQISNLLWAAYGINRLEINKRTVPSALNMQEYDIYLSMKSGFYLWNYTKNQLETIKAGDFRSSVSKQTFVSDAALILIYVADFDRMGQIEDSKKEYYSAADCGFICQNVYLFAASENLGAVIMANCEREHLSETLMLKPSQKIVFIQPVGFMK